MSEPERGERDGRYGGTYGGADQVYTYSKDNGGQGPHCWGRDITYREKGRINPAVSEWK